MTRRRLLMVCALLFLGAANAQPSRSQVWQAITPMLESIDSATIAAMSSTTGGEYSDYVYQSAVTIAGEVYQARIYGPNIMYGFLYAFGDGYRGDQPYNCYIGYECRATTTFDGNSFTISDFAATVTGTMGASSNYASPPKYKALIAHSSSGARGFNNIFAARAVSCTGNLSGQTPYFDSEADALGYLKNALSGISTSWALAAVGCINFSQFLYYTSSELDAWRYGYTRAKSRNANYTNFVTIDGLDALDDTPPAPDIINDRDGDGIPDGYDQYPDDPTNSPPPQESDWDVTPVDDGTNCRAIDIPCNFRSLFIPQVDWDAEFSQMRDVLASKMPFAISSWFDMPSGGGGCPSIIYMDIELTPCAAEFMSFWQSLGTPVLMACLYIGMAFYFAGKVLN